MSVCIWKRGVRGGESDGGDLTAHSHSPHLTTTKAMSLSKTTTRRSGGSALVAKGRGQENRAEGGDSRFGQLERRSRLSLEDTVHKDTVFAVARHKEVRCVVVHFQMAAGDERRVSHIDVDVAFRTVATDDNTVLSNHILELPRLQTCDRRLHPVRRVLRLPLVRRQFGRRGGRRFEGQEGPCIRVTGGGHGFSGVASSV